MADRPLNLPKETEQRLTELENLQVLGATRQLHMLADALRALVEGHNGGASEIARDTRTLSEYLISTRGQSSQAIGNALNLMLSGLGQRAESATSTEEFREWLVAQISEYKASTDAWMEKLTEYGANLLTGCRRVVAYDYSSSVSRIFSAAAARGQRLTVVLPESRILDGGVKYLAELEEADHYVELVPDSAVAALMHNCDMVLEGAETISAEGGCYNTTGTFQAALVAQYWRKPFYVASTSIKLDPSTVEGQARSISTLDLSGDLLGEQEAPPENVTAACPELDYTPPWLIHGFITELGVMPPAALWRQALRFAGRED